MTVDVDCVTASLFEKSLLGVGSETCVTFWSARMSQLLAYDILASHGIAPLPNVLLDHLEKKDQ